MLDHDAMTATLAQVHDLRAGRHGDVSVTTSILSADQRAIVGRSLATFQVGESGTGEHLFAAAAADGASAEYDAALRAFVAEEQEHARLLALVLHAIDHPLRTDHWTDRVFVLIRRIKSLRTEILTLLVAELIAIRYYEALAAGVPDPGVAEVARRIHDDEVRHVDFHAATLPARLAAFPAPVRTLVRGLWNVLVAATSVVVALDHGAALALAGTTRRGFVVDVWRLRADLDRRLFGSAGIG